MECESGYKIVKHACKYEKDIEVFLNDDHYFLVKRHAVKNICSKCNK